MAPHPAFCSCCSSGMADVPMTVSNRQGLSALSYRIGSFASFRRSMLDGIASDPRLSALSTRDSDDYAIVLLELFAAVADVLCG
jgi:hypothetical protein